jgi:hypothetical protein
MKPGRDEFAAPGRKVVTRSWVPRALAVVRAGLWLAFFGVLRGVVPRFEAIFRDFGVELSLPARATLALSHGLLRFGPLFLVALAALILYDLEVLAPRLADPSRRKGASNLSSTLTVLPILAIVAVLLTLLFPLTTLVTKLSG